MNNKNKDIGIFIATILVILVFLAVCTPASAAAKVDLFLVVDSSQNLVDDGFFDLQIDGLASAIYAIPQDGAVSVCVIQFSDYAKIEIPLTTISTPDNASWVSTQIQAIVPIEHNTNMSAAFYKVTKVIEQIDDPTRLQILDVSSDGWVTEDNTMAGRQAAIDAGLDVINVLGIGDSEDGINTAFLQSLIYNGFYIFADDPSIIIEKIKEKVEREINRPPDVSDAYPSIDCLWPPDHKFVDITIEGVTDPNGDEVTITITEITSDEPTASLEGAGGAIHAPDADGIGTNTASLRAERSGTGNGRLYEITFVASDGKDGETVGNVTVCVPHDRMEGTCDCIDDGWNYDATVIN